MNRSVICSSITLLGLFILLAVEISLHRCFIAAGWFSVMIYMSSISLYILFLQDEVVAKIEQKISAWTLLPLGILILSYFSLSFERDTLFKSFVLSYMTENSRSLQVLHYKHEDAKQNYDYFGNKSSWQVGESLMATVILYLSNVPRGGDITFPESQVRMV